MAGELDSLVIRLAAETADAQRQLRRMEGKVDRFSDRSTKKIRKVDAAFATMAAKMGAAVGGFVAAASGTALFNWFDRLARATNSMADMADTVGLTTDQFQKFRTMLLDQGMDLRKADASLQSFAARMGELRSASGSLYGYLKKANRDLAVDLANAGSQAEALQILEKAFEGIASEADRAGLAKAAFSKAGLQLAPILAQEGSQLDSASQKAREYGSVITDEAIVATRSFQSAVDLLGQSINAKVVNTLSGAISATADWVKSIANAEAAFDKAFPGGRKRISPTGQDPAASKEQANRTAQFAVKELQAAVNKAPPIKFKTFADIEAATKDATKAAEKVTKSANDKFQRVYETARRNNQDFIDEVKDSYRGLEFVIADAIMTPLNDAFEGNLKSAKEYFRNVLQGMANLIVQSQILKPLLQGITNSLSGGGTTSFGSILSSAFSGFSGMFGGFRASGGPVMPGRAYMVGERGPEMVVPKSAGVVIPNHAMGAGGSQTVYNIDARGAAPGVEQRILGAMAQLERQRPTAPQQVAAYTNRFPLRAAGA